MSAQRERERVSWHDFAIAAMNPSSDTHRIMDVADALLAAELARFPRAVRAPRGSLGVTCPKCGQGSITYDEDSAHDDLWQAPGKACWECGAVMPLEPASGLKLEREIAFFEKVLPDARRSHPGEWMLIKSSSLAEFFPDEQSAMRRGYEVMGNAPFLVRRVPLEGELYPPPPVQM